MKKIVTLFIIPIIILSVIGTSYALWFKTINLTGSVSTGYLNLNWESIKSNDPPTSIDPGYNVDVGDCNPKINPSSQKDNTKVTLSIDNAFPSYRCRVDFTIKNGGTIPTVISDISWTYDSNALEITGPDLLGKSLKPGQILPSYFEIHVIQPALQIHTYNIFLSITDKQWNG